MGIIVNINADNYISSKFMNISLKIRNKFGGFFSNLRIKENIKFHKY